MASPDTLSALLGHRAEHDGDRLALSFVGADDGELRLDYATLDRRARAIASAISERTRRGDRVLLCEPPSLELVCALFGCSHAGVVAVPVAPAGAEADRPVGIAADARPSLVVGQAHVRVDGSPLPVVDPRTVELDRASAFEVAPSARDDLALLQYTSGSTARPRGVMLSHANLLANSAAIRDAFGHDRDSRGAIWLPPHHDMGLVGGILQPVFVGFPTWLMPPLRFLQRPMRWLELVTRVRASTSGGPDFAYQLCARRARPDDLGRLDLSSWTLAFSGAEPVRPDTLARFAEVFAPAGFSARAFYPCYGLAEATLFAAGAPRGRGVRTHRVGEVEHVALGAAVPEHALRIVDPEARRVLPDGEVGEIWLCGPSVAQGYFGHAEATAETFGAELAGEREWLRTGDLGLVEAGELLVVGRIKDVVIAAGRKHHAEDLERTVEKAHGLVRPAGAMAFGVPGEAGEELAIAIEATRTTDGADLAGLCDAVATALSRGHGVGVASLVITRAGALPRTPTGKKRRSLARSRLLAGELEVAARWTRGTLERCGPS